MRLARGIRLRLATSTVSERTLRALPGVEQAAWRRGRRYVAGSDAGDALALARRLAGAGLRTSIDLVGERVTAPAAARAVADGYLRLADRLDEAPDGTWLSIDLSHIAFDGGLLEEIAAELPPGCRLQAGAEDAATADRVLDLVLGAGAHGLPVDATLQANLRRAPRDAERLAGARAGVRLVKGAYAAAQSETLARGREVDAAYERLAVALARGGARLALATHDAALRERVLAQVPVEACELLLGVHGPDALELARRGRVVRIYVPYGDGWFRYVMRRRAEAEPA